MSWFRKKPSMQEKRDALGLIPGSRVPFHRYAPMLRDAFNAAAMYRGPSEIADDMGIGKSTTPEQKTVLLETVTVEFSALYVRIDRLREVRPEISTLLDLHVAAISYLEGFMMTADRWNVGLRVEFQGNDREAAHLYAESDRLGASLQGARQLLAAELRQLRRKERTLYDALEIQGQDLVRLNLA